MLRNQVDDIKLAPSFYPARVRVLGQEPLRILVPVVLLAILAAIFVQRIPHSLAPFQRFDSSIFLYVGEQMRQGLIPYRDVWDHKPPMIFYLNDFGLGLAAGSPAGVFVLDFLASAVFFLLSYFAICGISGRTFSTLSCVFGLTLYQSVVIQPNLTEVECLPFQAISFLLLLTDLRFGVSVRRAFCQGILCGLLFWTRPNAIGITFVYVLAVAILTLRKPCITLLWRCGLACLAGICLSTGIIIAPVLKHASWSELWFATFQFNHAYAGLVGPAEHIHALYWMVQYTAQHGVIIFALAGCLLVFIRRPALDSVKNQAFLLTAIWLVVEALAAAYSGKLYGKNATLWILPSMCGIAFLFSNLVPISTSRNVKASLASLSVVASFFVLSDTLKEYRQNSKEELAQSDVVREIRRLSSSGDEVFFWGDFPTDVILRAGRPSGSRIFNSIPMMHGLSTYRPLAKIALQDLARTLPKLVVERCDSALPPLFANDPPNAPAQARWETNELQTEKKVLSGNYAPAWRNTPGTVVIFERVKESASFISAKPSRT